MLSRMLDLQQLGSHHANLQSRFWGGEDRPLLLQDQKKQATWNPSMRDHRNKERYFNLHKPLTPQFAEEQRKKG